MPPGMMLRVPRGPRSARSTWITRIPPAPSVPPGSPGSPGWGKCRVAPGRRGAERWRAGGTRFRVHLARRRGHKPGLGAEAPDIQNRRGRGHLNQT